VLRLVFGLVLAVVLTIFSLGTARQGWKDLQRSITVWKYPDIRDMRRSVALMPQKVSNRAPDSLTVPVGGWGDRLTEQALMEDREKATAGIANPVAAESSSIARGSRSTAFGSTRSPKCKPASLKPWSLSYGNP